MSARNAKLAMLLAYLAANGHPSLAPTWHARIWTGRPRARRATLYGTPTDKPATRRSRRVL